MARLARLNAINTIEELTVQLGRYLDKWHCVSGYRDALRLVATAGGQHPVQYLREHSWLPYVHMTHSSLHSDLDVGFPVSKRYLYKYALGPTDSDRHRFCSMCVDEDVSVWGFSHWRRLDQFPGIETCSRHMLGLSSMVPRYNRLVLPHDCTVETHKPNSEMVNCVVDDPVVMRYSRIADGLMQVNKSTNCQTVSHLLATRCKEIGLIQKHPGWYIALRNRILQLTPTIWLQKHFIGHPSDPDCYGDRYIWPLRNPKWKPLSANEIVLSLAVLFPNTEEALQRFGNLA